MKEIARNHMFPRLYQPINTGATVLASRNGDPIRHVQIQKDQLVGFNRRAGLSFTTNCGTFLAVSCTYLSTQWSSARLELAQQNDELAAFPLLRVAQYCYDSNTRYGFILTPKELVAIRVGGPTAGSGKTCRIEWQTVAWQARGPGVLTVDLGLWLIVMMSLHEKHRAISSLRALPLNFWSIQQNMEGKMFYRHPLSRREVFYPPAGAIFDLPGGGMGHEEAHAMK
ncbi:hypothetical protein IL306_002028 [Fusarium sp. DS 682]|nr:hypothetical protein IL306_002028 [Fusarium sp. DS 682]